jgi:hypothetical protein
MHAPLVRLGRLSSFQRVTLSADEQAVRSSARRLMGSTCKRSSRCAPR